MNARRVAAGERAYTITPFDLLTAAALVVFAEACVDVAVLEVGMGGRWDATSATDPVAVAITGIGLDHTRILGDTLEAIAGEKAAVIKPGRLVVLGEGTHEASVQRVMDARCRECGIVPLVVRHATTKVPVHVGDTVEFSCTTPRAIYTSSMVKRPISRRMPRARLCFARGIWVASSTTMRWMHRLWVAPHRVVLTCWGPIRLS